MIRKLSFFALLSVLLLKPSAAVLGADSVKDTYSLDLGLGMPKFFLDVRSEDYGDGEIHADGKLFPFLSFQTPAVFFDDDAGAGNGWGYNFVFGYNEFVTDEQQIVHDGIAQVVRYDAE
ncbi:MAG: hypothetical protein GY866_33615 [Proteobacteria bacterium]|nr:hypothetical protein [Pseudomonadota bacterium]